MGYNSNCNYQSCTSNCCNRYGGCPEDYSSNSWPSQYRQCYYYYNSNNSSTSSGGGAIAGYVIAGIAVIVFIAVFCYCKKKR